MMPPVAILAGGLATRLRPITEKIPKALVEISGQPFIFHQLHLLKKNRIERVVLCVGYRSEMIRDLIGDGSQLGMRVDYSSDWPDLLGTGGALKRASLLLDDDFFVLYGDSYLDCDYAAVLQSYRQSGQSALMTVFRNENKWDKSNISYQNGKILKYDKKSNAADLIYIDYGLSVLNRAALLAEGFGEKFDLAELFRQFCDRKQIAGHEVPERFYEIGTAEGIQGLETYLHDRRK